MTGQIHSSAHALDDEFVNVEHLGKLRRHGFQAVLEFRVAEDFFWFLNSRRLALNVGEDVGNFRYVAAHVRFEFGYLIVRVLKRHALVEFDVLFDVELARNILHADVVHVEIPMRGHGADAVKDVLRTLRARKRLHRNVGVGENPANRLGDGGSQLAGALEGHGAREAYGEIGEITVPRPADADAIDFENAVDVQNCVVDLGSHSRRSCVEQSVTRPARQAPTHRDHDTGHEQSGDGIGITQPVHMIGAADKNQRQPEHDHTGGPDVSGEVQCVGFQSLAVIFAGDPAQSARTPPIHSHREHHYRKGCNGGLDFNSTEEETQCGFVDNPGAGQKEQASFDKCREVLDFAVAVLMIGVCGFVGNAHRKKREERGDQVEPGVRRFRKNTQASGAESDHNLEDGNYHRSQKIGRAHV